MGPGIPQATYSLNFVGIDAASLPLSPPRNLLTLLAEASLLGQKASYYYKWQLHRRAPGSVWRRWCRRARNCQGQALRVVAEEATSLDSSCARRLGAVEETGL
jgi:hypothetical protein